MILVNTIDLSNSKETSKFYQSIYSSQLYGTFFVIFAKFKTKKISQGYKIKNITLRLMNYKGPINLGISRARFYSEQIGESYRGVLKVEVEALSGNNNMDFENVIIKADSRCTITNFIEVERSVKELSNPIKNGVFEEEFFYREGFEKKSGKYELKKVKRGKKTRPKNNFDNDSIIGAIGGTICPRSKNRVVK